jgi:hypothetical protein
LKESTFALYKGSFSSILGISSSQSLLYGFDGFFKKIVYSNRSQDEELPYHLIFLSSLLAS